MTITDKAQIMAILKSRRKANPIHLQTLSGMAHVNDRAVKEVIRQARLEGMPISGCSDVGYYWATNVAELDERINTVIANINTSQTTLRALQKTRERMMHDKTQDNLF